MWTVPGQGCRIAVTSSSSSTCLLTRKPAALQWAPQSLRLIGTVPLKATRSLPAAVGVKSTVTGRVVPRTVRSPVRVKVLSSVWSTLVEVKVMVGWLGVQELVAQGLVAAGVAGLDACGLDRQLSGGFRRVVAVQVGVALEGLEVAGDLGGHRVPGDETDSGERRVEDVVAGQFGEVGRGRHAWSLLAEGAEPVSGVVSTYLIS
jgi:hypothetical protein